MKLIDVLRGKNGHDTTRDEIKEQVQRRLNEVERKITTSRQTPAGEGLRSG